MLKSLRTPFPIRGDAYTVAAPLVSQKALERSVYNLVFRQSPRKVFPFASSDKIIFYGIMDYLRENLIDPITMDDIEQSAKFMKSAHAFGYGMKFDKKMWTRVVEDFDGRLPIQISAFPEGSTVFPGEPVIEVSSLGRGFGECAAIIEAVLLGQVAIASAAATMRRQLLAKFEEYVKEDHPEITDPKQIRFKASLMVHDFGMRASTNANESAMLGRAHLMVFPGTDTFNAAFQAWQMSGGKPMGTSIYALAHRTVQSHATQYEAFQKAVQAAIESASNGTSGMPPIVSLVSDCYDFASTIDGDLKRICEENPQVIAVARPDSGSYVNDVLKIVTEAKNAGKFVTQPNGRIAMTTRRFIQGDAMTWERMSNVMDALRANGFSPVDCGIFGVGGWLRNTPTRDSLSSAYKLCAMGVDYDPVVKLSDTRAKLSVPGPNIVIRPKNNGPTVHTLGEYQYSPNSGVRIDVYDGRLEDPFVLIDPTEQNFETIKNRCLNEFDTIPVPDRVWSDGVIKIQDETFKKFGRNRNDFEF